MSNMKNDLWVGVDVGSTTVKIAVVDPETNKLLHYTYQRHNAMQAQKVFEVLREAHGLFPDKNFRVAFCGSGGQPFAEATHAFLPISGLFSSLRPLEGMYLPVPGEREEAVGGNQGIRLEWQVKYRIWKRS